MTRFTSILVAPDFSIDGNNAVRRAALLAHEHGARLKLVHVLDPAGCQSLRDWFSASVDIDLPGRRGLARSAAALAGALTPAPWPETAGRLLSRRVA